MRSDQSPHFIPGTTIIARTFVLPRRTHARRARCALGCCLAELGGGRRADRAQGIRQQGDVGRRCGGADPGWRHDGHERVHRCGVSQAGAGRAGAPARRIADAARAPRRRAEHIINTCAHPSYRAALQDYFDRAMAHAPGAILPTCWRRLCRGLSATCGQALCVAANDGPRPTGSLAGWQPGRRPVPGL